MTDDGLKEIGPNKWRIRAQARDKRNGRKIERSETFIGTRREARLRRDAMRAELRGAGPKQRREKLRAYALTWFASRYASLKPSVRYKYENNLDAHLLPALGDFYLDAIATADVQRFIDGLIAAEYAPITIVNMIKLLRRIARDAVADGKAKVDFTARVRLPDVDGYDEDAPNLLTAAQLTELFDHIPKQWKPIIMLISFTGMRWGEASALAWEDIKDGVIRVRRGNWRGQQVHPKNKKSKRRFVLPPEVEAMLGPRRTGFLFPVRQGKNAGGLHRGTPLRKVLDKAIKAAGVPRVTTHGLRRTFNNLARQVADRQVVKAIMGHATDAMHEHYSQVSIDEKAAAQRAVIDQVIAKPAPPTEPEVN